jgi:TetR/AcrR family transcriptional regulator, cholesterol catabolism regulator
MEQRGAAVQNRHSGANGGAAKGRSDVAAGTPRRFDRYELLIDTAAGIFRRKGYDATSLQEISDEVGILKGSLYHYIDTKEDLLFAIIQRNHERIITGNSEWRNIEGDPVAAIRSFVEGHIRQSLQHPVDNEVYIRDFRALSEERASEILKAQAAYDREFRDLIKAAIDAELLRPGVRPEFASRAVFGMINWAVNWYRPGKSASTERTISELTDYAMASLLGPRAWSAAEASTAAGGDSA